MRRKLVATNSANGAHNHNGTVSESRWWNSNVDDEDESKQLALIYSLLCALFIRISLVIYGMWQDSTMVVKYTDVDYYVFSDASSFVTQVNNIII